MPLACGRSIPGPDMRQHGSTFFWHIPKRIARCIRGAVREEMEIESWKRMGKPVPPPHIVKQRTLKEYARRFSIRTFIETGTYYGDMVDACKGSFCRMFSVELDKDLCGRAKARFSGFDHISIVHGDSAQVLGQILATVEEPCLFWLDAHYSAGNTARGDLNTPVKHELEHIFGSSCAERHVILIDDARCFTGQDDYPTVEELRDFVLGTHPTWVFKVENDIIRIHQGL